jgi:superfamily II DNA/RNA helicase
MLDMGFHDDIAYVAKRCPKERQTLLFSATYPEGIAQLAKQFLRNPQEVKLLEQHAGSKIRQRFYEVTTRRTPAGRCQAAQALPPGQHAGFLQYQAAMSRLCSMCCATKASRH